MDSCGRGAGYAGSFRQEVTPLGEFQSADFVPINEVGRCDLLRLVGLCGVMRCCSDIDWGNGTEHEGYGSLFRGKHNIDGCDAVVSVLQRPVGREGELKTLAEVEVEFLRTRFPGVFEDPEYFNATDGGWSCFITVMRWCGPGDVADLFDQRRFRGECVAEVGRGNSVGSRPGSALHDIGNTRCETSGRLCDQQVSLELAAPKDRKVRVVGEYEMYMDTLVGRGRFGTVYRGVHREKGYPVAMKVLKGPTHRRDQMYNETRILQYLKGMNHRNVVVTHGTYRGKEEGNELTLVLVLEMCSGSDLKDYLAKHDSLSESQARHIMQQLVDCLYFLKEHGVMHRDLKPANILLTSYNIDEAVVKVADWGMAKVNNCRRERGATSPTHGDNGEMFESAVGTVAYMSPERLSLDCYDFQAEVWALGVIMYELLFARHPYLNSGTVVRTPGELLAAITRAEELDMKSHLQRTTSVTPNVNGELPPSTVQQGAAAEERSLSQSCYELLRHMLHPDAKKRCTIAQVREHAWFCHRVAIDATDEATSSLSGSTPTEAVTGEKSTGLEEEEERTRKSSETVEEPTLLPPAAHHVSSLADDGTLRSSVLSASERLHTTHLALHEYVSILRHNVIEKERNPSHGLAVLSYAWDLLRAATKSVSEEAQPVLESAFHPRRSPMLGDFKQVEAYVQSTARQLMRSLPTATGACSQTPSRCPDPTFNPEADAYRSLASVSQSAPLHCLPAAAEIMLQHAVASIRASATEDLILNSDDEQKSCVEVTDAVCVVRKMQRKELCERAMAILRVLLQQVVIRYPSLPTRSIIADTAEVGCVQVLNVPLVPLSGEADRRTVQALLHKVEKYYRRFFSA